MEFKASDKPGDYLVVEDPAKSTTWHLQVRDNGTPDHALMGAAHAALMSAAGYRGNKYEGPNKTEAIAKLKKLYASEGMTWTEGKALKDWGPESMDTMAMPIIGPTTIADALAEQQADERVEEIQDALGTFNRVVGNIMASPDVPDKGAAVEREAGAFRQWLDSILSAAKSIMEKVGARHSAADLEHLQTIHDAAITLGAACKEQKQSAFTLFKDNVGAWQWLAIASNNRRDSDHPAQILTEAAHKEFIGHLDAHPEALPALWHWHTPGTRWGKADTADYVDGFVVYAGTVDAGHEAEAAYLAQQKDLGVSHGFFVLDHDAALEHIKQYRTFEVSPLPRTAAANRWTSFQTIQKEVGMPFAIQKRAYLVGLLGEDRVKQLEQDLSARKKTLDALGIEAKEETPEAVALAAAKPDEAKPEEPKEKSWFVADMTPDEFTRRMTEIVQASINPAIAVATKETGDRLAAQLFAVSAQQAALDARLKSLEGLTPRGYRASQDPGTAVDQTKAKQAAPGADSRANEFASFVLGDLTAPR